MSNPGNKKLWFRLGIAGGALLLLGLYIFWYSARTWQYEQIAPDILYRTGLRTSSEFVNACNASGCRTVLLLLDGQEQSGEEAQLSIKFIYHNRLKYFEINIPADKSPTPAQVKSALDLITNPQRQPVLLFCADGRRSAMLAAAYRLSVQHLSPSATLALARQSDLSPDALAAVSSFINTYPATLLTLPTLPTQPAQPVTHP